MLVLVAVLIVAALGVAVYVLLSGGPPPEQPTIHFEVTSSDTSPRVGQQVTLTVRALNQDGSVATSYRGTVHFTSDDPGATLPSDYAFQAADVGVKTFPVTIAKVGAVVITVTDTADANVRGNVTLTGRSQDAPAADFTLARTKMHVAVDASASTDPNNDIATYAWDWGDTTSSPPSASPLATHDYTNPGRYTITLTIVDATSLQDTAAKKVSVATSTIDYDYYDFFKVPYGEWWDYRTAVYGDLPIGAECFNASAIANGVCTPTNPAVADAPTYPYTNWYPLPGSIKWDNPNNVPLIYAPYRFRAVGVDVGGYNVSEPVFLPVLNYNEAPGSRLDFDWRMQYLDTAAMNSLTAYGCPGVTSGTQDGFKLRSQISLTMDLQESKRIFGVVATDRASAQAWWAANAYPVCGIRYPAENATSDWFVAMGGGQLNVGKYDVYNSFEWYYQPFYTNLNATVDPDGTTHVLIDHTAWGTEVMLARMFYWGNASYLDSYLDSTKARGWWGMELGWFEDMVFTGSLKAAGFDFSLSSVMQYHFQLLSLPGPNGQYDRTDDIPYWTWGPVLTDYTNDASPRHLISELDRYPSPTYGYIHTTPGGGVYGSNLSYDYAPVRWNLPAGQTWHFQFTSGNVLFYDPNSTPVPANPTSNDHVRILATLQYSSTRPLNYGDWDGSALTWDVYGPAVTGGPDGSPGNYALEPWGAIRFVAGPSAAAVSAPLSVHTGGTDMARVAKRTRE